MRPDGNQRQFWRTKISKCAKTKKLYRGVAKLVSRQFRVLETVGSNPATSTKKEQVALAVNVIKLRKEPSSEMGLALFFAKKLKKF